MPLVGAMIAQKMPVPSPLRHDWSRHLLGLPPDALRDPVVDEAVATPGVTVDRRDLTGSTGAASQGQPHPALGDPHLHARHGAPRLQEEL